MADPGPSTGPWTGATFDRLIEELRDPDAAAEDAARARIGPAVVARWGRLGELALWWASVTRPLRTPTSQEPPDRTGDLAAGPATVSGIGPVPVTTCSGVGPWTLPAEGPLEDALAWGVACAEHLADAGGHPLILLTVDDPEAARALAAGLIGLDAVEASGWPDQRGLTDPDWMVSAAGLRDRIHRLRGLRDRPVDLLTALGSPALAAAVTLLLRGAALGIPALLDGPGAAAAALLARRTHWGATRWWQAAHLEVDPLHERVLDSLALEPMTRLGVTGEDGTAVLAGLALLTLAVDLLEADTLEAAAPDGAASDPPGPDSDG